MSRTIYFISHPEVEISKTVPVTQWRLSKVGRARMERMLTRDWIQELSAVYTSEEQKAIDGAEILANFTGLTFQCIQDLGENDRSSTGFLKPTEFESTADQFFAFPEISVRGWEKAVDAQSRIVEAVKSIGLTDATEGSIAIISHGAVGTLLYCFFSESSIDRRWDQPGSGGVNYLKLQLDPTVQCSWWKPID